MTRTLRGLREGDLRSLYTGAALLAFGLWRRNRGKRGQRELIYRRELKQGEAIMIRTSRSTTEQLVIDDALADQVQRR
jgi:hypothetical protein